MIAQRERWMVSYVDVLTILLIFFLAAAAKLNQPKPDQPVNLPPPIVEAAPPPAPPNPLAQTEQRLKLDGLEPKMEPRGLTISLPQAILFSPGDDKIRRTAFPTIEKIASELREIPNQVNLVGHSDATPIRHSRFRNNWDLAAARSLRLMELLTSRYGVEPSRLSISSYGPSEPKSSNDTADGRASNRRVEILILSQSTNTR
jgi:chemotaxis protein MotB